MLKIKTIATGQILVSVVTLLFLSEAIAVIAQPSVIRANGKIAFTSDRDDNLEIYVMNNDGTQQVRLTNNGVKDFLPTFSPDGSKIAYISQQTDTLSADIKIMNADGTAQTKVTTITLWPYPEAQEYTPRSLSWSPDATKIAFDDENEIFTINVDGGNRKRLTNSPGYDEAPAWSRDGTRILFVSSRQDHGYLRLHSMNAVDGGDVRVLPSGNYFEDLAPDWSPAGNRIVFVGIPEDFHSIIYTANADGTNRQVFDGDGMGHSGERNKPKWSPDGTKIVFHTPGTDCEIFTKNVDGTGLTRLTNTTGANFQPSWQPLITPAFPTVSVSGRVLTPDGRGLRNAAVTLTDSLGATRTATTGSFGSFTIDNVRSGETYVVGVASKRYRFAARSLQVTENLSGVDYVGVE